MNALVAGLGVALLLTLAVLIGASLDTEAQRVQWRHLATERRLRAEELRQIEELRQQVREERRRLRTELDWCRDLVRQEEICVRCPLHRLKDLGDGGR